MSWFGSNQNLRTSKGVRIFWLIRYCLQIIFICRSCIDTNVSIVQIIFILFAFPGNRFGHKYILQEPFCEMCRAPMPTAESALMRMRGDVPQL